MDRHYFTFLLLLIPFLTFSFELNVKSVENFARANKLNFSNKTLHYSTNLQKRQVNYLPIISGVPVSGTILAGGTNYYVAYLSGPLQRISISANASQSAQIQVSLQPQANDYNWFTVSGFTTSRVAYACTSSYYISFKNTQASSSISFTMTVTIETPQLSILSPIGTQSNGLITMNNDKQEYWYFNNNVACNNVTVAVTSLAGSVEKLTVSRGFYLHTINNLDCSCSSYFSTWVDGNWGAAFKSVPLTCLAVGTYFIKVETNYILLDQAFDRANYTIIVATGNQEATCAGCVNGKCYNGVCRCWEPYTGAQCTTLTAAAVPLPLNSYALPPYRRIWAYYNSVSLGTSNLYFYLRTTNYPSISVNIGKNGSPVDSTKWYMQYTGSASSGIYRDICNAMGTGIFIIRIDNYSPTSTAITMNATAVQRTISAPFSITGTLTNDYSSNNWIFYRVSNALPTLRATLNGTSSLDGLALVDSNNCGYWGVTGALSGLTDIDYGKQAFKVDFFCQAPATSEYYIAVSGNGDNYTLDVTNAAPNCPNNCSGRGVCKNSGACACYWGWTGTSCTTSVAVRLSGTGPWSRIDSATSGTYKYYYFIPSTPRPIQFGIMAGTATTSLNLYADSLYGSYLHGSSGVEVDYICGDYSTRSVYVRAYVSGTGNYNMTIRQGKSITKHKDLYKVTTTYTSGVPLTGIIYNRFPLLYELNVANNQVLHVDINVPTLSAITTTLNAGLCNLYQSTFPPNTAINSIYFDIPTCRAGTYYLLVSSNVNQTYSITITQSPASPACPNCCSNIGTCNANGTCSCPLTWTGTDCSTPAPATISSICNLTNPVVFSPLSLKIFTLVEDICGLVDSATLIDLYLSFYDLNGVTCNQMKDFVCKSYYWSYQYQKTVLPCMAACNTAQSACSTCSNTPVSCQVYNASISPYFSTSLPLWCNDQPFLTTSPLTTSPLSTGYATSVRLTSAEVTTNSIFITGDSSLRITTGDDSSVVTTGDPRSEFTTGETTETSIVTTTEGNAESQPGDGNRTTLIAAAAGGGGGALLLLAIIVGLAVRTKRKNKADGADGESPSSKRASKEMNVIDTNTSSDFGDLILSYNDLILQKKIGEGAFGEVYKGEYKKTKVAIKVIPPEKVTQKEVEEFKAEAKVMKLLPPHPNIVLFRGVSLPPDPLCIVLEYCKGGSLVKYLKSHGVGESQKMQWAKDIARGMLHLHTGKKGYEIIHRDLAARNILLKEGNVAAVADFGMARMKEEKEDISKTKQTVGPLKWMAPESIKNQQYSKKTDSFSYGVVIWEIVTQKDPWEGETAVSAAHKVLNGERLQIPEDCPAALALVMQMCWKAEPNDRPDFEQILDVLKVGRSDREPDPADLIQMNSMNTNYVEARFSKKVESPYNNLGANNVNNASSEGMYQTPPAKSFYDQATSATNEPPPAMYEEVGKK